MCLNSQRSYNVIPGGGGLIEYNHVIIEGNKDKDRFGEEYTEDNFCHEDGCIRQVA